jgi:hypothetical protein
MIIPKNSKDAQGARDFFTGLRTQACSLAAAFGDPLKSLANDFTAKIDSLIAKLPAGDPPGDWSLETQLENVFGCLAQCSALASLAGLEATKLKSEMATQVASGVTADIEKQLASGTLFKAEAVTVKIADAIKVKLDANELVPQTRVTQLCSAAKTEGIAEGEKKAQDAITAAEQTRNLILKRRGELQTASFPLPDAEFESVLGLADAEFGVAKTTAESRIALLEKDGIAMNSDLLPNIWAPEADFNRFRKTALSIPALKLKAEPLLGGGGAGDTGKAPVLAAV